MSYLNIPDHKQFAYLLVIGGDDFKYGGNFQKHVDIYKLSHHGVMYEKEGAVMPYGIQNSGSDVVGRDVYVIGGSFHKYGRLRLNKTSLAYNFDLNRWTYLQNLNFDRGFGPAVFHFDDTLYTIGGSLFSNTMESLDLSNPGKGWQIENVTLPYGIQNAPGIAVGNTIYICGRDSVPSHNVIAWTPGQANWTYLSNMINKRMAVHCTVTDKKEYIWVIGTPTPKSSGFVERYTLSLDKWEVMSDSPYDEMIHENNHICVYWGGLIFVTFRGDDYHIDDVFFIYDTNTNLWNMSDSKLRRKTKWPIAQVLLP